jgi:hypothetical protein
MTQSKALARNVASVSPLVAMNSVAASGIAPGAEIWMKVLMPAF